MRSPVVVSTSTTVASSFSEAPMSVQVGRLEASPSRPGSMASIGVLGLKPSLRFHSVRSMATPASLVANPSVGIATRSPVSVALSAAV